MEKQEENRIKICALLITLMQGVPDVGFNVTFDNQITQMMLDMAATPDLLQQAIAAELIVETTSKARNNNVDFAIKALISA